MKILVTGNKGYIGSVLTPMLIDKGYEVKGYDSGYYEHCLLLPFDGEPRLTHPPEGKKKREAIPNPPPQQGNQLRIRP